MALSIRLDYLASFHQGEEFIYDIGCDHGLLGLRFLSNPNIKEIHLSDPNPYSIDIISKTVDADIPEHICLSLMKERGENIKITSSNSLVFIAGMGGKTIVDILKAWSEENILNCRSLVLSPHRNQFELRDFLIKKNLSLISESVIYEGNQFYEVIVVSKAQKGRDVSIYGKDLWKGEVGAKYLAHQKKFLAKHQDSRSREFLNYLNSLI